MSEALACCKLALPLLYDYLHKLQLAEPEEAGYCKGCGLDGPCFNHYQQQNLKIVIGEIKEVLAANLNKTAGKGKKSFDLLRDVPKTDEEVEIALRRPDEQQLTASLHGFYRVRRRRGDSVLEAYEKTLKVAVGEYEEA